MVENEYPVTERVIRPRIHPGEILKEEVFPATGLSITAIAKALHTTRMTLYRIMQGEQPITPAMALKLERFCGGGAQMWLNMQHAHDLHRLEQEMKEELASIERVGAA